MMDTTRGMATWSSSMANITIKLNNWHSAIASSDHPSDINLIKGILMSPKGTPNVRLGPYQEYSKLGATPNKGVVGQR